MYDVLSMNHYEFLAIISGKYAENESTAVLHTIEDMIKKHASAFHYSQNLERRKLAYPIQHHSYGTYILVEFDCDAATLKKIDHELTHTNEIIRYTIVRRKKVGAPKEIERKEQKAFATASAPVSSPAFTHTRSAVPEYIPVSPAPVMQAPLESPSMSVATAEKTTEPAVDLDAAIQASAEESKQKQDDTKKGQKKVTYEELDKKLDEILNSTIL